MNLVNAIVLFLPLYFLSMIAAVIAAARLIRRSNANKSPTNTAHSRWIHYSFIALFLFFLLNLVAESTAWIRVSMLLPTYNTYTFNYLLNVPAILLFFAIHVRNRFYNLLIVTAYGGFVYVFIEHKLWLALAPIPFVFGIVLFSSLVVASTIFLASSLISHSRQPNQFKIHLGLVFLLYNFLALFIAVFMLDHKVEGLDPLILFYINGILALLYYTGCAIVMFRYSKKLVGGTNFYIPKQTKEIVE